MNLPLPATFNPVLTSERLQMVANWLLEELYATEDDLSRFTDSGYTKGCTTFGRQRNRIIKEALSSKHDWLQLPNSRNDLVFEIGGVPCRFSNDDPSNPTKEAVTTANRYQTDFLEFAAEGAPGRFCFVVDRGVNEAESPRVEFLGFSPSDSVVCRWVSDTVRVLRVEGNTTLAPSVPVAKPQVAPKRRDEGDAAAEAGR
jgi:hypothetical protein